MAKAGGERQESNSGQWAFGQAAEAQMDIDTYPYEMVGQTVNDAARSAFPVREARKLAIGIVERVCAHVQRHAGDVRA